MKFSIIVLNMIHIVIRFNKYESLLRMLSLLCDSNEHSSWAYSHGHIQDNSTYNMSLKEFSYILLKHEYVCIQFFHCDILNNK
jgi:hypothetical protein